MYPNWVQVQEESMAFNLSDFLNTESKKQIMSDWKPVRLNIHQLRPAPEKENFYHIDDKEIVELATSIELVGLQQYPVVTPINDSNEYMIIAGHKRRAALLRLLAEGKTEFEMIPCKIDEPDIIKNELVLIFTNSTQRERSDYEKMREIERVRELLAEYQKTHELVGRKQQIIADILGMNKTKVGTLDKIDKKLISSFKGEFAEGRINTNTANELASLSQDEQQAAYKTYKESPEMPFKPPKKEKVIKNIKESKKGQETAQDKQIKEEKALTESASEPQKDLCKTCIHNGECTGKKTHESGCMGYEAQKSDERKGIEFDKKILEEMIEETERSLKENKEYWLRYYPNSYTRRVMELTAYKLLLNQHEND